VPSLQRCSKLILQRCHIPDRVPWAKLYMCSTQTCMFSLGICPCHISESICSIAELTCLSGQCMPYFRINLLNSRINLSEWNQELTLSFDSAPLIYSFCPVMIQMISGTWQVEPGIDSDYCCCYRLLCIISFLIEKCRVSVNGEIDSDYCCCY
jgi:hypothetical protein